MNKYLGLIVVAAAAISCGRNGNDHDASGIFEAEEVIVSSEANGRLVRFDVAEGDRVYAGEMLGFVDTTQLFLRKAQLLSSMNAVGSRRVNIASQIAATRQQIATQKREKERVERLLAANAANRKQLDDIVSAIAVLESQLAAQQETLENNNRSITAESSGLEIQVAQIEDQLAKSYISSPIDGTVLVKYARQGELTAGGKPLFKVADTGNMTLRAYVTSGQMTQLQIGQKAAVFTDFGDGDSRRYEGTVTWISDRAEFTPKTIQTKDERENLVYAVRIAVENDGYIKIGMYGDVKF